MHLAKVSDIHIPPDRQRKSLDDEALEDLMRGIADKCLLHPITCRKANGKLVLVSGERRLSAIIRLAAEGKHFKCNGAEVAPGSIPYTLATELSDLQHKELELEENLLREDLSWRDRVVALFELDQLRREQNPEQTLGETAMEVGRKGKRNTRIERDILEARVIVPHLDDPAVRGARNRREAFNIACRLNHAELARELAVNLPETHHTLRLGDMARVLPGLPSGHFDCIIADPPYGLNSSGAFGDAAKLRHDYEDSLDAALAAAECIAREGYRVAKARAHLYLFCDIDQFLRMKEIVARHRWKPWRTPLIWDKGSTGHAPAHTLGWRRSHELILFASKGGKRFSTVTSDVIRVPNVRDKRHAAEKPTGLYVELLKHSCLPRDRVLDPCCGSGTIFQAARETHITATGIECDEKAHGLALTKLQGAGALGDEVLAAECCMPPTSRCT